MPRRPRPTSCRFLTEYQRGKVRVVCRPHNDASRWLPNLDAINWRNSHERHHNREEK